MKTTTSLAIRASTSPERQRGDHGHVCQAISGWQNKMMKMGSSDTGKNQSESGSFFARGTSRFFN
jgi:hypothetical protein